MRSRPLPLPSHDRGRDPSARFPSHPAAPFRWAAAVFGSWLLAGCLINPMPAAPGAEEDEVLAEPAAQRSQGEPKARAVSACTRVWNASVGDSTWRCPDPRPPAPDFGRSG